ncbi:MAG: hypothetical protein K2N02_00530, partial [Alistipes sp.]|nr:hypothetical protein [Alistipes sp.]
MFVYRTQIFWQDVIPSIAKNLFRKTAILRILHSVQDDSLPFVRVGLQFVRVGSGSLGATAIRAGRLRPPPPHKTPVLSG